MKRREFFAAAGIGTAAALAGETPMARAADKKPEKRLQVYKCEECGTIIEVVMAGMPSLVHCGKPMTLLEEKVEGAGAFKHVPVIEKIDGGYRVKVGATSHPMTEAHHIAWIDLIADGATQRAYLQPGAKPEAAFLTAAKKVCARAHCNLHGLWKDKA